MPRTPQQQVYQQMINDLKAAQGLLNTNYVDATDTAASTDHVRPNKMAATALLSRVYLYNNKPDSAEAQATAVISNPLYSLPADLTKVFIKNSAEAVWQLFPASTDKWTLDGSSFILTASPGNASLSNNNLTASQQLLNDFEPGDQRMTNWMHSFTNGANTWYYPFKYRDANTATVLNEYTMMLRLAEQYLIRSEARALQNNLDGAVDDLNAIRTRAGLTPITKGTLTQQQLLAKIAHERRVELFTEGDRWLDLKRTKMIDAVMGDDGACAAKGGNWNTNQQLYPIYFQDIINNSNLVQNPGY